MITKVTLIMLSTTNGEISYELRDQNNNYLQDSETLLEAMELAKAFCDDNELDEYSVQVRPEVG